MNGKIGCILVVFMVLLVGVLATTLVYLSEEKQINDLDDKVYKLEQSAKESKRYLVELENNIKGYLEDIEFWKYQYYNNPVTVYSNNTEYDTEYVFLGDHVYDVNRDGKIDYTDVKKVWRYIVNDYNLQEEWFYSKNMDYRELLYDVNCDGKVNEMDAFEVLENMDAT